VKRALLVGIDYYANGQDLAGCVNDVQALLPLLARNEDDSLNLDCRQLVGRDAPSAVTRDRLLQQVDSLYAPGSDYALFYFAGHGAPYHGDVTLVTSDATANTLGVRFTEILEKVGKSDVQETTVILDCCFSGGATTVPVLSGDAALLRSGLSVLTASRGDQTSKETTDARGQFSVYLEGGLDGGAADILGRVTVAGLYSYLSESFGAWDQRPTFKANVDRLHDVRVCNPRIPLPTLRQITTWFPRKDHMFSLDRSFEPTEEPRDSVNEAIFSSLQKLRAARLVDPVGEEHMYYAAMNATGCVLTALGKHYWNMVKANRI
jgi:hypothetical protein